MHLIGRVKALSSGIHWASIVLLLLVAAFAAWLGLDAYQAKSNLEKARNSAEQSKDALLGGNSEEANRFAEAAQFHAREAQTATHSLPWNAAAAVPLLGSPLKATQQITDVVVGLADDVLLPGAKLGAGLSPERLIDGTRLDLSLLRAEQPRLAELAAAAAKLDSRAKAISNPTYLSLIRDARSQLQDQTSKLAQLLGNTSLAAQLAPSMLGAGGSRTYLMGFQTNAEARGTGGLLGGVGILRFDDGKATVDTLAPNTELANAVAAVDLGPEFNRVYGWTNPYTDYRNSNMSPHFPYAAEIWSSMWANQTGQRVDGVIAIDPVALSYLLGALGPITMPDGEVITEQNVVELTMSTAYARFPAKFRYFPNGDRLTIDNDRKEYLQGIAREVVKKLTGQMQSPQKMLDALGRAIGERRISVWSANPADQQVLEETPLAHVLPRAESPYSQVVINNLAGNKMDYYLRRQIEYVADICDGDTRNSTVTVRLTNISSGAPLPEYVGGTPGLKALPLSAPSGTMVSSVKIFATKGAVLMSVTSNGERTSAVVQTDRGRPSFEVQLAIPPGASGELTFRLREPTAPGEPLVELQPLVDELTPKVEVPTCS